MTLKRKKIYILRKREVRENKLIRHFASIALQTFYKKYIKCDNRDVSNRPTDPIYGEGIPKEKVLRNIYQTFGRKIGNTYRVKSQVQYFDIESLWMAILATNKSVAINPLTNTAFTQKQFNKILNKAVECKLIEDRDIKKYNKKYAYGFRTDRYSSRYEVTGLNIIKNQTDMLLNNLTNYLLTGQTAKFLEILDQNYKKWWRHFNEYRTNTSGKFPYLKRWSLVQIACAMGDQTALLSLLEVGGEITLPYSDYIYPMQICMLEKQYNIISILKLYGGQDQIELDCCLGLTPLEIAHCQVKEKPDIYHILC